MTGYREEDLRTACRESGGTWMVHGPTPSCQFQTEDGRNISIMEERGEIQVREEGELIAQGRGGEGDGFYEGPYHVIPVEDEHYEGKLDVDFADGRYLEFDIDVPDEVLQEMN